VTQINSCKGAVAEQIVVAWLTTIPVSALLAAGLAVILRRWL